MDGDSGEDVEWRVFLLGGGGGSGKGWGCWESTKVNRFCVRFFILGPLLIGYEY